MLGAHAKNTNGITKLTELAELVRLATLAKSGPEFQENVPHQKLLAKLYQKLFKTASLELMATSHPLCVVHSVQSESSHTFELLAV